MKRTERLVDRVTTSGRSREYVDNLLRGCEDTPDFYLEILEQLAGEGVNPFENPLWNLADEAYHVKIAELKGIRQRRVRALQKRYDVAIGIMEKKDAVRRENDSVIRYEEGDEGEFREAVCTGSGRGMNHVSIGDERMYDGFEE